MNKPEEFTARLMRLYWQNDCCDIDGEDIQEIVVKSGLAIERPVTAEDIANSDHMQEWGVEPGDTWVFPSPLLLDLLAELK